MVRLLILLTVSLLSTAAISATVYKTVHPDGTVEFSSDPQPGAEPVQIPELPTYQPRQVPSGSRGAAAPEKNGENAQAYTIQITQPAQKSTVFFNTEGMSVAARVQPGLKDNQQIVFLLDGKEVARGSSTTATIQDIVRGTHTLSARIENDQGQVLATSGPVTFYMRQHSRLNPNRTQSPPPSTAGGASRTVR